MGTVTELCLLSPATSLTKICMVSVEVADEAREEVDDTLLMLLMLLERAIMICELSMIVGRESSRSLLVIA
jgi:hypothetical protein